MSDASIIAAVAAKAGGYAAMARELGITREAVRLWHARGRIPAERVIDVERVTGVPREILRPDLYRRGSR